MLIAFLIRSLEGSAVLLLFLTPILGFLAGKYLTKIILILITIAELGYLRYVWKDAQEAAIMIAMMLTVLEIFLLVPMWIAHVAYAHHDSLSAFMQKIKKYILR